MLDTVRRAVTRRSSAGEDVLNSKLKMEVKSSPNKDLRSIMGLALRSAVSLRPFFFIETVCYEVGEDIISLRTRFVSFRPLFLRRL